LHLEGGESLMGRMYDQCVRPELERLWDRIFEAERDISNNQRSISRCESWIDNAFENMRALFERIESLEKRVKKLEKENAILVEELEKCKKRKTTRKRKKKE